MNGRASARLKAGWAAWAGTAGAAGAAGALPWAAVQSAIGAALRAASGPFARALADAGSRPNGPALRRPGGVALARERLRCERLRRFWQALALALMGLLPGAMAQAGAEADTRPGVPVVVGSPAWQALMALPAEHDGQPTFWAADLLVAWGRGADAARLRRSLLVRHLEAQAAPPPAPATLGQLWQAPVPGHSEVASAQRRAQLRAGPAAASAPWAQEPALDDGAVLRLAERIGNRPPADVADFVRRWGGCVAQGTCPEREAWLAARAASEAERQAAIQAREAAFEARRGSSQRRGELRQQALLLAGALGGLLLHLLVARVFGRWAAIAGTVLLGLGLAVWLVVATGPQSGWGGLALLILAGLLGASGLLLAPLYDWIHRRWFARR